MVTETQEKAPFSIEDGRKELEGLTSKFNDTLAAIGAATASGDVSEMVRLGGILSDTAVKRDRLQKRIERAERGEGSIGLEQRVKTRDVAINALVEYMHSGETVANLVREMLVSSPGIKQIRLDVENMTVTSASVVGGFRKVTSTGNKRPRAQWGVEGATETLSTKDAILQYGQKYGQAKPAKDMTPAERQALLKKIVEGESFINHAGK